MKKTRGTYQRVEKEYTLSVDYTYYWDNGDYYTPPEADLEVTDAYVDSDLLPLEFYLDFIHEKIEEDIHEYAQANR